jgi:hypothetical protein
MVRLRLVGVFWSRTEPDEAITPLAYLPQHCAWWPLAQQNLGDLLHLCLDTLYVRLTGAGSVIDLQYVRAFGPNDQIQLSASVRDDCASPARNARFICGHHYKRADVYACRCHPPPVSLYPSDLDPEAGRMAGAIKRPVHQKRLRAEPGRFERDRKNTVSICVATTNRQREMARSAEWTH